MEGAMRDKRIISAWVWQGGDEQPFDSLATYSTFNTKPGLTVAICTYRRPESLRRLMNSLARQTRIPDQVVVVDATEDNSVETMLKTALQQELLLDNLYYVRVTEPLRGLTRQRNLASNITTKSLLAFFDDDTVLDDNCLKIMEATHLLFGNQLAGVGAYINEPRPPDARWKLRRLFRVVPNLQPGRYHRAGLCVPWQFLEPCQGVVSGDYLPGCASMWRTDIVRRVRFRESFAGYGRGEDIDFSLRAKRFGALVLNTCARVKHLHDPRGRPDPCRHGYMVVRNSYLIHRECLVDRRPSDTARFFYSVLLDMLMLARHLVRPRYIRFGLQEAMGRAKGLAEVLFSELFRIGITD